MRKFFFSLLAGSILVSCNNKKSTTANETKDDTAKVASAQTTVEVKRSPEEILGSYVGAFGDNKITLLITRATDDSIEGRSIVGGNDRPFKGTYAFGSETYNGTAKEPGDHKNDGTFNLVINRSNLNQVTGNWIPNDNKQYAKDFTLERKKFEYKSDVGNYPEASQRLLKADDIEDFPKSELEYMRNEIFARHGYCFNKKKLRQDFEMQEWYVPNTVDIKGYLTDIEKKNIAMIKRYEKYAEDYGDEYGR